jgi:hypothetical protein
MSTTVLEREQARSAGEQAMKTLTEKWYNTMVTGLNLSPETFQIYQSNVVLGNLSTELWAIYDSIPPLSVTHQADSQQISRFSDNYSGVINTILPSGGLEWKKTMGDSYPAWVTYLDEVRASKQPLPSGGMLALFTSWAQLNIPDPGKAQKAITQYSQILNGVVPVAQGRFINAAGVYAYNKSIDDLRSAVKQAPSGGYTFDSRTASSDISHTWARGNISGAFRFLWGGGSASYDKVNEAFGTSTVNINVSFKHVLAFAAGPLLTPTFVGDKTYPGWFSSAALTYAYQNKGNDVWPVDGSASWASTFGDNGNLKRFATNLVVGDEMTMTLSSSATFSTSEREQILTQASGGFWPFFRASGSGGFSSAVTFDDRGKMTATATSPAGSPLILGVSVLPIDRILS